MINIFYSWQSDLPGKYSRNFIEDCIKKAINNIHNSDEYNIELTLERDTKNTPGTPDIANTIFDKIRESHIFICDISIINSNTTGKKTPNPNVLLELGYAASVLGWENVVCLFNEEYAKIEELPFDLKFRRHLSYKFGESSEDNKVLVKSNLIKSLEKAIVDANPKIAEDRREIYKEFDNESVLTRQIAINKPDYWRLKLVEELLRSKLIHVNKKYADCDKGLIYRRITKLTPQAFWDKFETATPDLTTMINFFSAIMVEELNNYHKIESAVEIRKPIDQFINACYDLLEWEMDYKFIQVSGPCNQIREKMLGATRNIMKEINLLPDKLKSAYSGAPSSGDTIVVPIALEFTLSQDFSSITQIIKKYGVNILSEEDD